MFRLICILSLLIFSSKLYAEENEKFYNNPGEYYFWLSLGVGEGTNFDSEYAWLAGGIMPSLQYKNNMFNIRQSVLFEFMMEGPTPDQYIIDTSFLFGRCIKSHYYYISLSTGPGFIRGVERGKFLGDPGVESYEHEELPFKTIGVSLDLQLFIITPIIGFGGYLFYNINTEQSYFSLLVCLQFGHILSFSK